MNGARIVSAALAFTVCAVFGTVRRARMRREAEIASLLAADVCDLERMLRLERRPIAELAGRLAEAGGCREFWRGVAEGIEHGATFGEAYASAPKPEAGKAAAEVLSALAEKQGSGDAEGESVRIKKTANELADIAEQMRKTSAEKGKLTGTLSLLAGLAAALLII